jgi:tripartite-type tricarboxylate transporter receptor subunit TctC
LRRTIRDAIAEVMRDPDLAKRLAECGYEPIANTPETHQAQTAALVGKWLEIGKTVNLKERLSPVA